MLLEAALAALGPAQGELHGMAGALAIGGILGALVEGHDDVGAESDLGGDRALRAEEMGGAVEVRAEGDAVLADLAQVAQAEDLEAPGVGQDGAVPAHEMMQ